MASPFDRPDLMSKAPTNSTPAPNMSVAPPKIATSQTPKSSNTPVSLPFSPTPQSSPVYTNQAGRATINEVKKQAENFFNTPSLPPPKPAPGFVSDAQAKADAAKQAAENASKKTPGTIQQAPKGFQAVTENNVDPVTGKQVDQYGQAITTNQQQQSAEAKANIQKMNDAATAAGVTASFDPDSGVWINTQTGMPQVAPSSQPIHADEKWGSVRGDIIQSGQYMGLTTGQAEAIEKAGKDVQDQFNPVIKQQEEQSKQQQANALIRGGQSGGFLNSQVSGAASTDVGSNWVGSGGTLDRLKTEYEASIQKLKDDEAKAINQAKDYALTAARTGNAQYLDAANAAQRSAEEAKSKQTLALQDHEAQLKSISDIKQYETANATETISNLVTNGYTDFDKLPKTYTDDIDKHLQASGMPPGSARMLFATTQKALAAKNISDEQARQKAEIDNAKGIVGMLKDIPQGKSIAIGNQTYTGTGQSADQQHGVETNDQGKTVAWSWDPETGVKHTVDLGYVGKASDGFTNIQTDQGWFSYNQKTGVSIPLQPSEAQTTWQATFPNGSQSPYRSNNDPMQGQCAAFTNDLYGPNSKVKLGNSFKDKQTALESYKVDPQDAQVGDTFLMTAGDTGHVGIIAGIKPGPNGKQVVTCLESNMVPPGNGKISTTRTMNIDDPRLKMVARVPTDPTRLPPAGPDSPFTAAAMGQPTIGGKSLSELFGINDSQQKFIDSTIGLVSKGTLSLDTAQQRLSRLKIDPSQYMDQLSDASAQGHLTQQQKADAVARLKASITATQARTVNSVLSPLGFKTDPSVVGYKTARANINRVYAADNQIKKLNPDYSQSNAALDLELADAYVRMATGNAVTENQVNTLKNSQGWVERGNNLLNQKKYGGFLSPEERKQIISLSGDLLNETKKSSDEAISQIYQPALEQYGVDFKLNPDDLLRAQSDTSMDENTYTGSSAPPSSPPVGEIWVKNKNGEIGSIPEGEFDDSQYTKV